MTSLPTGKRAVLHTLAVALVSKMQAQHVLHVCILKNHEEESGEQDRDWVDLRSLGGTILHRDV